MPFEDILDDILKTDKDKERTEDITQYVAFIVDESSSMLERKLDAIRDFNQQIETLEKESGDDIKTLVTVTQFNDQVRLGDVVSLDEINKLSEETYRPSGMTALYDAIGDTALKVAKRYRDDNSDAAVLMVIITDGMENVSQKYNADKIKSIIKELEGTGRWTFTYMGIGSEDDLFLRAAHSMGFTLGNVAVADNTADASSRYTKGVSMTYQARRSGETQTSSFYMDTGDSLDDKEEN